MDAKLNYRIHIALDIVLLGLTMTLFDKGLFGLLYHEIAGIIMLVIMITHIAINLKMIRGMCENFSRLKNNIRACLIVDVLLVLCFVWIGISGVLCSHKLFTQIASENILFKLNHMFFGALSAILLGVHTGLHICRKWKPAKVMITLTAVFLVLGVMAVPKSNMPSLLAIPKNVFKTEAPTRTSIERQQENQTEIGVGNAAENRTSSDQPRPPRMRNPRTTAEKVWTQIAYLAVISECAFAMYWICARKKKVPQR